MDNYTWQVTGQTPEQQIDAQGNIQQGKTVSFTVQPQGYSGTIFIPDIIYQNVDAVREMIQHEVEIVVAVHGLSG